ncbi:glycosyltransferase family 2 protein [Jonesiaceae bacterium BS-20]|uniref:Glycosyltransferase family 2 protein n=1 Tax=Jonesiaceae bacterium BS-20 TaxID=3120821 RepID=A0AAU7DYP4_9MICO
MNLNPSIDEPKPKISVVIPHFNSSATLARALASVERQTYQASEILVVDDRSTPQEVAAALEIIARIPHARLIRQPVNAGPASARNAGWNEAAGDWVAFLDSDDAWHPQKLELQIPVLADRRQPSMVGSQIVALGPSQDFPVLPVSTLTPIMPLTRRRLLRTNPIPTSSVLLRASPELRFTDGRRYTEDYEVWLKAASINGGILLVDLPLVARFKSSYGASGLSANMLKMARGELETFVRVYNAGTISAVELALCLGWSAAKSVRRLAITGAKRLLKKVRSTSNTTSS